MPDLVAPITVAIHPGLPFVLQLDFSQRSTPDADAVPCDLSGYTAAPLVLRSIPEDRSAPPATAGTLTTIPVVVLDQATSGQGSVTAILTGAQSALIQGATRAYAELVLTSPAGLSDIWAMLFFTIWAPTSLDPAAAALDNTQLYKLRSILLRPPAIMQSLVGAVTITGTTVANTAVYTAPTNGVYLRGALLTMTGAATVTGVASVRFKRLSDGAILSATAPLTGLNAVGETRYVNFDGVSPTLAAGDVVVCEVVTAATASVYTFTVRIDRSFI